MTNTEIEAGDSSDYEEGDSNRISLELDSAKKQEARDVAIEQS
jgi:hypothetical protein